MEESWVGRSVPVIRGVKFDLRARPLAEKRSAHLEAVRGIMAGSLRLPPRRKKRKQDLSSSDEQSAVSFAPNSCLVVASIHPSPPRHKVTKLIPFLATLAPYRQKEIIPNKIQTDPRLLLHLPLASGQNFPTYFPSLSALPFQLCRTG